MKGPRRPTIRVLVPLPFALSATSLPHKYYQNGNITEVTLCRQPLSANAYNSCEKTYPAEAVKISCFFALVQAARTTPNMRAQDACRPIILAKVMPSPMSC